MRVGLGLCLWNPQACLPSGGPSVVSLSLCCSGESLFSFSIPPGMLMPPRRAGTVPQERLRCVLNFGPRSFNAWWQREWMLFGFLWNSPPFLFSVERPQRLAQQPAPEIPTCMNPGTPGAPGPHGITKAPCETQWKIRTFVQVFRASIPFKTLRNPSCY